MKLIKTNENKPILPISVVADILGVHQRTLMVYEYEMLVVPKRSKTNRRMYSQKELKLLKFIQYLTRKKRLNYSGIRIILSMIKIAEKHNIDLKSLTFPTFKDN